MKAILLIIVVYAHSYAAQDYKHYNEPDILAIILQTKCDSNAGNTRAFYKLKEGLEDLPTCVFNSIPDLPNPLEQHEEFCRGLRESEIYKCVSNFTVTLTPCLDETEAYFPDLMLTMVNTSYNELCGEKGLSNIQYLFSITDSIDPEVNSCLRTIGDKFMSEATVASLTICRNLRDNSIINLNAKDLCSDLKLIQRRFSLLMKQECNEDYSRFVDLYSQPFLEECNILHI